MVDDFKDYYNRQNSTDTSNPQSPETTTPSPHVAHTTMSQSQVFQGTESSQAHVGLFHIPSTQTLEPTNLRAYRNPEYSDSRTVTQRRQSEHQQDLLGLSELLEPLEQIMAETDIPSSQRVYSEQTRDGRTRPHQRRQIFPLGTREDVEREDYQSPVAGMFMRAWERYRTAEETRQAERTLNPLSAEFVPTSTFETPIPAMPGYTPSHSFHSQFYNSTHPAGPPPVPHREHYRFSGRSHVFEQDHDHTSSPPQLRIQNTSGNPDDGGVVERSMEAYRLQEVEYQQMFDGKGPNAVDLQKRPPPMAAEEMMMDISCKICKEQKIDTLTMPCHHLAMCHWCATAWQQAAIERSRVLTNHRPEHKCPVCRHPIKSTKRVHLM